MSWTPTAETSPRRFTVEEIVGALLMLTMVAVLFVQVIARFIIGDSLSWSEELARYIFIWLIFLCLGSVTLRGQHIAIDILVDRMPARPQRVLGQVCLVIAFAVNCVLLAKGLEIAYVIADLGQSSAALALPMWIVYAALPTGLALASLRSIQASVVLWRAPREDTSAVATGTQES